MNPVPKGLLVRSPDFADVQAVFNLQIACDTVDFGEPDSDINDIVDLWKKIDLGKDAWLVYDSTGQLVGYAAVNHAAPLVFDLYTLPQPDKVDLNIFLLQKCEERVLEKISGTQEGEPPEATIYIPHVNEEGLQAAEKAGFQVSNFHFRMQIDLVAPPESPVWPEGITLQNIIPGQDDQMVHQFIQTAFERPGRTPQTFKQWHDFMMRPDHFHPELWYLAFNNDELVGAALCFDYPENGWVRQLGVADHWRKKGLGAALLHHVFSVFYGRGQPRIALVVNSENLNAFQFYKKVGMQCTRQFDEFHKSMKIKKS